MKRKFRITAILAAIVMLISLFPLFSIFAAETLSTDVNEPFRSDVRFTAGGSTVTSNSFRIPAMVTLKDGSILAAADIRWNTTYDGGGLDTLTARSTDGGVTWTYKTANYLGDNENVYNGSSSTCFIDPCLTVAADGQTVYMLVDIYPYGIALNGIKNTYTQPSTAVGFTNDGYLKLSSNNHSSYDYYLKDGKIYSTSGTEVAGYTVDEYFNLTGNGVNSNLFYSNSPYKVVRTGFLYLTKSTDGGKNWSAPTLLNLKTSSEKVCLVGPGRGITTSDGAMIFPVYSYNGSAESQRMGFIYSKDGKNWDRVDSNISHWSSEAAVVEIGTGILRFFYRNGNSTLHYVDYNLNTKAWGSSVDTGIATNSNTQISAITYSRTSDGKQVVLVSCPAGKGDYGSSSSSAEDRVNGRIFVFTVEESGALTRENNINVNDNVNNNVNNNDPNFMYSCLTERSDGSIAILFENYESGWGENQYYTMDMKVYSADDLGLTFDEVVTPDPDEPQDPVADETITMGVGETITKVIADVNYANSTNDLGDSSVVQITVTGQDEEPGGTKIGYTKANVKVNDIISFDSSNKWQDTNYYYTPDNGANYYKLQAKRSSSGGYFNRNYTYTWGYLQNGTTQQIRSQSENSSSISNAVPNIDVYNRTEEIAENKPASTTITFKGISAGTTYATIGETTYKIIVNAKEAAESAFLLTGSSAELDPLADLGLSGDYTVTYEETEDPDDVISISGGAITAGEATGTAKVTATVKSANGKTVGTVVYTITVGDVVITDTKNILLPVGGTVTIAGLTGELRTAMLDTSIATVVPTEGTLTNEDIEITGKAVGDTSVIVGSVKFNIFVNPQNTNESIANTQKKIYIYIDEITNCSVYYAVNAGPLHKVEGAGLLIDQTYTGGFNIMFFAAPDEGYALTKMAATTSTNGQYYSMAGGTKADASDTDAWPFVSATQTTIPTSESDAAWKSLPNTNGEPSRHGFRWALLQKNFDIEGLRDLLTRAKALGANGATTFTKNEAEGIDTHLTFAAEKLPTMEKNIVSYKRDGQTHSYTDGTWLQFGDVVTYEFVITTYSTTIKYTDIELRDDKIGYVMNIADNTFDTADTYKYKANYTISEAHADEYATGAFYNEATLSYTQKSTYSTGKSSASASANVSCRISGIVYYTWMEGLPEAITTDSATYPRPAYAVVQYGDDVTVQAYTGAKTYQEINAQGIVTGTWTFKGWEYNGALHPAGTVLKMPVNENMGFVGVWEYEAADQYTVTYTWTNAPAGTELPVNTQSYYSCEKFTVDGTYGKDTEIEIDGVRWTFSGWMLSGAVVTGEQTVGAEDITLVGRWSSEQMVTSLTITKEGCRSLIDGNQTFLFRVTGTDGTDVTVMIEGDGSATVRDIIVGESYTIKEETDWSWRYTPDKAAYVIVAAEDETQNKVTVKNTRTKEFWLDGNAFKENIFGALGSN